jgi:threonylcarbamoyladenosine tRNA methylthiotransferase MtaB
MKIFLDVVGCRLNQSEIEGFANQFRALGHEVVADPINADLTIVNTCAVTVKAAADSRKKIRRAAREGTGQVLVTGCWVTLHPEAAGEIPGVSQVVGNPEKDSLVAKVLDLPEEVIQGLSLIREPLPGDRARTRAFIKVQEGCDNACTYCLTRLARGRSRSRDIPEVTVDIQAALRGGAKEMVLTGVQLGAWGRDLAPTRHLEDLVSHLLVLPELERLRLSSIEPWDFTMALAELWSDVRLCPHFHIPLQSGSDRLLKEMGRPFSMAQYHQLVQQIRDRIPEVALTTDMIVGFPGETEADFEHTKAAIQDVGFAGGHVFSYSPRAGTAAFKMKDRVPPQIAKTRNAELRRVFQRTGAAYRERFLESELRVLWETAKPVEDGRWLLSGLTDNYLRVYAQSAEPLWNVFSTVKVTRVMEKRGSVRGKIIS